MVTQHLLTVAQAARIGFSAGRVLAEMHPMRPMRPFLAVQLDAFLSSGLLERDTPALHAYDLAYRNGWTAVRR